MGSSQRDRTACMMRIRNEGRWIRRSLERTWQLARTVVVFDDGSTDHSFEEAIASLDADFVTSNDPLPCSPVVFSVGDRTLHWIPSIFRSARSGSDEVHEIRDKNLLWSYCKAHVDFEDMLCLDGDEMWSLQAIDQFERARHAFAAGADVLAFPVIYLWDDESSRRVDGLYGNAADNQPLLRFARAFTVRRKDAVARFDMHFPQDGIRAGLHCGSVPRNALERSRSSGESLHYEPIAFVPLPIVHFGYLDPVMRQAKFDFYNEVDPNNEREGHYLHLVGRPNIHAPHEVRRVPWRDDRAPPVPEVREYLKLNIGCGERPMAGFVNTDAVPNPHAQECLPAWDLGCENESVSQIECHHVIEHFFPKDWPPTLNEWWRVLKPGGILSISCPDFGVVARGYAEGRYSIDDARMVVMATCPPFNSCDYQVPESYHRTCHSEESLRKDLTAKGFTAITARHDATYAWNLFVCAQKPHAVPRSFAVMVATNVDGVWYGFREVAETLHEGLTQLGFDSELLPPTAKPSFPEGRRSIVLAPHLLPSLGGLPDGTILYNLEQRGTPAFHQLHTMIAFANAERHRYAFWDYADHNAAYWATHSIPCSVVPIGYVPALTRWGSGWIGVSQDIDVLFYGVLNERRKALLDRLRARGLRVVHHLGYGSERDELIRRSKIVLNVHFYEPGIFEIVRVSYLLANHACVVSETGLGDEDFFRAEACAFGSYGELESLCCDLVMRDEDRAAIAARGHAFMKTRDQARYLKTALCV